MVGSGGQRKSGDAERGRAYAESRLYGAAKSSADTGGKKRTAERQRYTVDQRLTDAENADRQRGSDRFSELCIFCPAVDCKAGADLPGAGHGKDGKKNRHAVTGKEFRVNRGEGLMDAEHDHRKPGAAENKSCDGAAMLYGGSGR